MSSSSSPPSKRTRRSKTNKTTTPAPPPTTATASTSTKANSASDVLLNTHVVRQAAESSSESFVAFGCFEKDATMNRITGVPLKFDDTSPGKFVLLYGTGSTPIQALQDFVDTLKIAWASRTMPMVIPGNLELQISKGTFQEVIVQALTEDDDVDVDEKEKEK